MSTSIENLPIDPDILQKIMALNVNSIEALLSLFTALGDDPEVLLGTLGIDKEQLKSITETIKASLPAEVFERLSKKPPVKEMPLGAFLSETPEESASVEDHAVRTKKTSD